MAEGQFEQGKITTIGIIVLTVGEGLVYYSRQSTGKMGTFVTTRETNNALRC